MHRFLSSRPGKRSIGLGGLAVGLLTALAASGCGHKKEEKATSVSEPPTVRIVHPDYRPKIVRTVGNPSFVEAYERTSIYPKVKGYIKKWNVDIGDKVKKGDVLATLFVPELEEDWVTKKRTVTLCKEKLSLAEKMVLVAEADVQAADAKVKEAVAIVDKYKADTSRWDSEVVRLEREVKRGVVDPQVLLESQNQHRQSKASWAAADAAVLKAKAELLSKKATLDQDVVAVKVEAANVLVAESDAKRLEAWVGYLTLPAPYDGVITARNANTWDIVLPAVGDPSTDPHTPHLSPGNKAAPIYVIDRTDIVRIFVDIPEQDANYVHVGSKAKVQIKAFRDKWIPATVTRISWALNFKSRTLRAEVDLPNIDTQILPGVYAYGKVIIERPRVRALPEEAIVHSGDSTYYWSYVKGHAHRVEVQTGISDGKWIEVTNRQSPTPTGSDEDMIPVDGTEPVILGDLSVLTEGCPVKPADESPAKEEKKPD